MTPVLDFELRTRVVFGPGVFQTLGEHARQLGFQRCLLVADEGVRQAGYVSQAVSLLHRAGVETFCFHDFGPNPDTRMVEAGREFAKPHQIDSIIGLGGGSSLDCAKGINFLLTNGGSMKGYWGWGKAQKPMLPMIGIPTTAGTGSEAQSYALISDAETHVKMACGDPKAAFRLALLDPVLACTAPAMVRATAGYDAISHAVETWVTRKRTPISLSFSMQAWQLLNESFERVMAQPQDVDHMGKMLLGSHLAGMAIEQSMLGAAHACANPLTAHYGIVHGTAIGLVLRHVVRWNEVEVGAEYRQLHPELVKRLSELLECAGLPRRLAEAGVDRKDFPQLAEAAGHQWTGRFNPRSFDAEAAKEIYEWAW
ncbi:MAG: iron-containing alcohol dehydrogenase [Bryobacteraceae bacterium]|nr:iron-containing alcohol dehydrogenase [Bryobacteraceae bacterium]MDW8380159.1 iron-containing alcohol dehydrogenase [Bryobacterales bacterium]